MTLLQRIMKIKTGYPKIYDQSFDEEPQEYGHQRINAQVRLLLKDGISIPYRADCTEIQALFDKRK